MRHALRLSTLAVAGILTMAACSGGSESATVAQDTPASTAAPTSVVSSTTPTSAAAAAAATTTSAPTATTTTTTFAKVPANTASRAELTAAITAAGVSNAARWSIEVEEYRPYPTNDPTFAKLRQNLVKYNPGPGVVDGIVSALSL